MTRFVSTATLFLISISTVLAQPRFVQKDLDQEHGKVLVADINNDGFNDIIKRGSEGEALVWYEFKSGGSFVKHVVTTNVRFRGDRIQVADIDADGDLDLVTGFGRGQTDQEGLDVVWLVNPLPDADPARPGSWEMITIGPQSGYMKDLSLTDFNRDGKVDVVARTLEQTSIYIQNAPDRWVLARNLEHESHEGIAVGDLDLDGDPDIVLNGFWFETPDDIVNGQFEKHIIDPRWFTPVENTWRDNNAVVALADITGDGILDIVTGHSELPGYPLSLYTAQSIDDVRSDRWSEQRIAGIFDFCQTLDVADVDNDGDLDILAAKFERNPAEQAKFMNAPPFPVVLFLNEDGKGRKWIDQALFDGGMYAGVFGDVGSDGDIDVVGPHSYWSGPIRLWENQLSDESLSLDRWHFIQVDDSRTNYTTPGGNPNWRAFGLATGDISGDGYGDIVSGKYFYQNPGGDMEGKWKRGVFPIEVDASLLLDVDGDEYADVIAQALPAVYWLEAKNPEGTDWSVLQIGSIAAGGHGNTQLYGLDQLVPGGKPEILLAAEGGSMVYLEIPVNPEHGLWPQTRISTEGGGYATGDIDGDGFVDVAGSFKVDSQEEIVPGTARQQWNNSRTAWWKNPGDGTADWQRFTMGEATQADRFELADVNGDGRLDLIVTEERYWGLVPNANLFWYEQPDDPCLLWQRHTVVTQTSMNNLDVADIDRDGDIDIITNEHRMPQGDMKLEENERTQIWENDGKGNFTGHDIQPGRETHLGAQTADLDQDGDLDIVSIAWRNSRNLYLWRNDANRPGNHRVVDVPTSLKHFGDSSSTAEPSSQLDLEVYADGFERLDRIVEIDINFTHHLQQLGNTEPLNLASLHLVELDAEGNMIDPEVVFQFDTQDDFDPSKRAVGTLVFNLQGTTPALGVRRYRLFFGERESTYKNTSITPRVLLEDVGEYQGNPTWKISTPGGTYYYHRDSGGFAGLIDKDGNDWISYRPGGRDKGEFRGIPNIAPVNWHPGSPEGKKESQILARGPLRIRLLSESEDGLWRAFWDVYPHYATLTIRNVGSEPYWILYEGTPGGEFNLTDYWVDSSGRRFNDMAKYQGPDKPWHGDLPAPEWVYFGDAGMDRVMYYIHHEDDQAIDEFWHFGEGGMTVFGFGRGPRQEGWQRLSAVPAHLTVGFSEVNDHPSVEKAVDSVLRPIRFSVGRAAKVEM